MAIECRRAYSRAYEATQRLRADRVTVPVPQAGAPDLPPRGVLVGDDGGERVQCHVCGLLFRRLAPHVATHLLTPDEYRAEYGLPRTLSLASPADQLRHRAIARGQSLVERGRERLAALTPTGRPKGTAARDGERILRSIEGKRRRQP